MFIFIFIIKLSYNYNKLVFNFCLNTNSMWELYLFENIILTSLLEFVYSITFVSLDQ